MCMLNYIEFLHRFLIKGFGFVINLKQIKTHFPRLLHTYLNVINRRFRKWNHIFRLNFSIKFLINSQTFTSNNSSLINTEYLFSDRARFVGQNLRSRMISWPSQVQAHNVNYNIWILMSHSAGSRYHCSQTVIKCSHSLNWINQ